MAGELMQAVWYESYGGEAAGLKVGRMQWCRKFWVVAAWGRMRVVVDGSKILMTMALVCRA
ncbi:unnamed protein product [Ilex paraguariensis]|uniref:Uncharacterized protein n=1 Tax=Ilex paraguariensis TaxID=185542 RepID=A0ABC8V5I9_9AQUA